MKPFEQEFKEFLRDDGITYEDNSASFVRPDFSIRVRPPDEVIHVDVKEKRQKINVAKWNVPPDAEPYTFIIDDLAARKALRFAPYSGLIIRNNLDGSYYWFDIVDLFLMPKRRVNRPIEKHERKLKGKWIIDLRNGRRCTTLEEALKSIHEYLERFDEIYARTLHCLREYVGEQIDTAGTVRRPGHWRLDAHPDSSAPQPDAG